MPTGLQFFTGFHTALSLVALAYGVPAILNLFPRYRYPMIYTTIFIILAFLSTFTGFFFPFHGFTPAIGVGIIVMVLFTVMYVAYKRGLTGPWRWLFALGLVGNEFFLVFVTIAQSFQKIAYLHHFAPTGAEPPFAIAEGINLAIFAVIGIAAAIKFQPFGKNKTYKLC